MKTRTKAELKTLLDGAGITQLQESKEVLQQLLDAKGLIGRMDDLLREMDIDEGLEVDSVTELLAEADKAAE